MTEEQKKMKNTITTALVAIISGVMMIQAALDRMAKSGRATAWADTHYPKPH